MNAPTRNAATRDQLIFHLLLNSAKLELWINQAGDGIELDDPTHGGGTLFDLALDLAGIPPESNGNTVERTLWGEDGDFCEHPDYDWNKVVTRDGYKDEFGELIRQVTEDQLETAIKKFMARIQEPHEDSSVPPAPPSGPSEVFVGGGYMAVPAPVRSKTLLSPHRAPG